MSSHRLPALRFLVPLPLLALLACSAQSPAPPPTAATPAPPPAPAKKFDPQQRVQWYQACWAQFNDKKWDEFRNCYAPTATARHAGYGRAEVTGAADILADSQQLTTIAPDVRGEQQLILVNNSRLASLSVLHGTQTGPMKDAQGADMKPTGKRFGFWFAHNIEVDTATEQVTREFGVDDSATMTAQIGLSHAPARPAMAALKTPPTVVIAANDAKEAANIGVERASVDAWNRHDPDAIAKTTAPKLLVHDATAPRDMDTKANNESNNEFWRGFGDARLTARYWAAGDYVVVDGLFEGTNDGDFAPMKIKKTGRKVTVPFLEIDRFEDGKVRESWVIFDSASLAAQLTAPAAGEAAAPAAAK